MANNFLTVSDGTFTLSETAVENQFYFYRNDGATLNDDVNMLVMDFYKVYIMSNITDGEIKSVILDNIFLEKSDDNKCVRLTIAQRNTNGKAFAVNKCFKSIKRLIRKMFS